MQTGTLLWTAGVYTRYYRMMCVFAASIRRFGHEIHQSRFINRSQLPMAISGGISAGGVVRQNFDRRRGRQFRDPGANACSAARWVTPWRLEGALARTRL